MNKLNTILLFFISVFDVLQVHSQNASFDWMVKAGGMYSDYSRQVAVDSGKFLYIVGEFRYQSLFDTTHLFSSNYDLYLAKYSQSNGSLIWVRQATASEDIFGTCLTIDYLGNVYVAGLFLGNLSIGDTLIQGPSGIKTAFLAKYDMNGQFLWARSAYSDKQASSYDLTVNSDNEIYWLIWFQHTITFQHFSTIDTILINEPDIPVRHAVAIAKINGTGNLLYIKDIFGDDCVHSSCIHVDHADNYYISGVFYDNINFGDTVLLNTNGGSYLAKLNKYDHLQWIKQTFYTGYNTLCTDADNNLYVGGVIVPNYIFENVQLTSYGGKDILIAKYDSSGNFKWLNHAGSSGDDDSKAICIYGDNNILLAGTFNDTAYFGNDSIVAKGGSDFFVVAFDSSGNFFPVRSLGTLYNDDVVSIDCQSSGEIFLTGTFTNKLFWENDSLSSFGSDDAFLAKFNLSDFNHEQTNKFHSSIHYYPNPCDKILTIDFPDDVGNINMELITMMGQPIYSDNMKSCFSNRRQWNVSHLPSGIYMLRVTVNNEFFSGKLIIAHP